MKHFLGCLFLVVSCFVISFTQTPAEYPLGPDSQPQANVPTCGDKVYKRKLKVQGAHAWAPPLKPAAPRL